MLSEEDRRNLLWCLASTRDPLATLPEMLELTEAQTIGLALHAIAAELIKVSAVAEVETAEKLEFLLAMVSPR